jgi:hypothetical protein
VKRGAPIAVWLAALLGRSAARSQSDGEARGARGLSAREIELALTLAPLPPLPPDPSNALADDPRAARLMRHLPADC